MNKRHSYKNEQVLVFSLTRASYVRTVVNNVEDADDPVDSDGKLNFHCEIFSSRKAYLFALQHTKN